MTKKKITLTGGKFNRIHKGHIWLLKKAKKLGFLVVVLAHDAHNKRHYAIKARTRKENLEKLGIADKVVIGDEKRFSKVIKKFKPNTIVLGYDQSFPDDESKELAKKMKIKVVKFRKHGKYETQNMQL